MEVTLQEFKTLIHSNKVRFKYSKKDGSEREAYGTTNLEYVPNEYHPSGTNQEYTQNQVRYFDLDKNGWRSFLFENLIEVIEVM